MSLDLSRTATRLLSTLAKPGHVRIWRTEGANFDPVEGEITGGTQSEIPLIAAVIKTPRSLLDDNRVEVGDITVIADNAEIPRMEDAILIPQPGGGDKVFKIVALDFFNHAGTVQFWRIVCRG